VCVCVRQREEKILRKINKERAEREGEIER